MDFPCATGPAGLPGSTGTGQGRGEQISIAGAIFIILALFFTSPQVLSIIAIGVLGALLVFVGIEMGRHSLKTDSLAVTIFIGILAVVSSMTVAFIIGMAAAYLLGRIGKKTPDSTGLI